MIRRPPRSTLFPYTDALPISPGALGDTDLVELSHGLSEGRREPRPRLRSGRMTASSRRPRKDRKSTRLNSSHTVISYAVFCLKKKKSMSNCQLSVIQVRQCVT